MFGGGIINKEIMAYWLPIYLPTMNIVISYASVQMLAGQHTLIANMALYTSQ